MSAMKHKEISIFLSFYLSFPPPPKYFILYSDTIILTFASTIITKSALFKKQ